MPPDTPAQQVWDATVYRREERRQELLALSLSICAGISVNMAGGDTNRLLRPFYTSSEWTKLEEQQEEERQLMAQRQQLAKIMRMSHDRGA